MHTIHRAIGSYGRYNTPQRGCSGSQTHFLTFHRTIILCNSQLIDARITTHFLIDINTHTDQKSEKHYPINTVSQFLPAGIESQCKYHCHRNNQNRPAFCHVSKISRIFQWMRRVYPKITTTIRTQLFNRDNCSCRSLRNHLLLTFHCGHFHLSIKSHWSSLKNQDKTYNQRKR